MMPNEKGQALLTWHDVMIINIINKNLDKNTGTPPKKCMIKERDEFIVYNESLFLTLVITVKFD